MIQSSRCAGDYDDCIELAKACLTEDALPEAYVILYSMLLVRALDNWDEAKLYLRTAEHTWCYVWEATRERRITQSHPKGERIMVALRVLRRMLDTLKGQMAEDEGRVDPEFEFCEGEDGDST